MSDAAGRVEFTTIYPGWYAGRAVHIHLRVRTGGALFGETYGGGHVAHTGHLFLPEAVSDEVFRRPPYASHGGERQRQVDDPIFAEGGPGGVVALRPGGPEGYVAVTTVAFDPESSPAVRR
jgi:hypothetical protein